jgi:thymidylate synthase
MCLVSNHIEMMPGKLTIFIGDCHIYENHVDKFLYIQKDRPLQKPPTYGMMPNEVFDFEPIHFSLLNYECMGPIDYPFNV